MAGVQVPIRSGLPELIIYDFDGVIADSETVCNVVLAEMLTAVGLPTTLEDALTHYCGRRWVDCLAGAEQRLGRPLPADFGRRREAEVLQRLSLELEAVPGAGAFIDAFGDVARCIGSSSAPAYIDLCLEKLGLADRFGSRIYSAAVHVRRGKPHPDLFLHAAAELGVRAAACVVIEDSAHGVEAGVAAGMTVIGLCAGSHVRPGHGDRLRAAGAHYIAKDFDEAERAMRLL
jgi:HAD superfamily hydrolase (TIGR01509 family)